MSKIVGFRLPSRTRTGQATPPPQWHCCAPRGGGGGGQGGPVSNVLMYGPALLDWYGYVGPSDVRELINLVRPSVRV